MRRRLGAVALVGAAVLAVAGSLRPLYEQWRVDSGHRSGFRMTLWGGEFISPEGGIGFDSNPIRFGVPVVAAAALLAVVGVLVLVPVRLPARAVVAVRVGAVAAAALLLGSVWTVGQLVLVAARERDDIGGTIETTVGTGFWVLLAACAVALAGGLLVQHRRAAVYQLPDDDETDTPPMGVPIHPSVSTEESSPG
jgi:hypothetical protein